ncbi:unnamed protein product [Symbiodinium sp. CCMP2456]|nr:unnamed protein product [Symbiodinium sp. CCMP2456]
MVEHLDSMAKERGLTWAVAGRNLGKLRNLVAHCRSKPGLIHVTGATAFSDVVARCHVVISAAGPYCLLGEAVIEACVKASTHYIDVCGELPWMYDVVQKYHREAQETGVSIVISAGNVSVPEEVLCYSLVRELGPLQSFREYFSQYGGVSGGTLQSQAPPRDGSHKDQDPFCLGGIRTCGTRPEDLDCTTVEVDPWFPHLFLAQAYNSLVASRVVRRSCQLFEQSGELIYGERLSVVVREAQLQKSVAEGLLQQLQPSGDAVERIRVARERGEAPWPGQGPPARTREMYGSEIIGVAQGESGDWAYARWTSGCAYEVSSMAAVSGALILAERKGRERARSGVVTPAYAFHSSSWIDLMLSVPFANGCGRRISLDVVPGKPTEEEFKMQITEKNRRMMQGQQRLLAGELKAWAAPSLPSRNCAQPSQAPMQIVHAAQAARPGLGREDPTPPCRIADSHGSSVASVALSQPCQPGASRMSSATSSQQTPRQRQVPVIPAAPPPSPASPKYAGYAVLGNNLSIRRTMPLTVRRCGKQVHTSADNLEAYQLVDDDLGRLVQWTLGSQQELWEVRFVFTHVCGPNGGTVLGLGFGTADARMEEVDILECESLAVCDAYDGEINILGQQVSKDGLDLCEPSSGTCEEESITAMYDSSQGLLRFTVDSRRCRGQFRVDITKETLRHRELYPTVAFANRKSKVRIELIRCLMAMPVPRDERLLRRDFSTSLAVATEEGATDFPSGCVIFEVDGRKLRADKFLLAARSVYFERMLHTGMSEGAASRVPIPRASAPAFEAVLRFIYSAGQAGQVLFEHSDPLEVLHLSVEFLLEDLTRLCEWKLMQGLTLENALATFGSVVTVRNQVPALVESCIERMQGRMKDVVGSESFKELCRSEVGVRELLLSLDEPLAKRRRMLPGVRPG